MGKLYVRAKQHTRRRLAMESLKGIYNGDIGFIQSIDIIEQTMTIDFETRFATFEWSEAAQLALAYVVSVH